MINQLGQTLISGKLAHAYLFFGEGEEKVAGALRLAMTVNCSGGPGGEPCEKCLACRKIKKGNHPDVSVIEPSSGSFKIDQIRELQKRINYKHFEAKYKVLILKGAEQMTIQAANSILKMLEEPPDRTIFILTAQTGNNILPTVKSRCQTVWFNKDQYICVNSKEEEKYTRQAIELTKGLADWDSAQLLDFSGSWEKNRDAQKMFLGALLSWLRDIAVAKLTGKAELIKNPDSFNEAVNCPLQPELALQAALDIQRAQYLLNQNINARLLMDVVILKLARMARRVV